ncbi:hypothetical protein C0995_002566 [Termitomyces sp. Mi166|nr:hypothetical protein C0995_002566 [Termitomyces sp. Mi166\
MAQHGAAMGIEFRGKGINVALAPMIFGGDPYLSGEAAFEVITGIQSQGVQVLHSMASFEDQINGSYACENDKTLNGILKSEFEFPGYVMSDWWGTHSTLSVNSGLDARAFILTFIHIFADATGISTDDNARRHFTGFRYGTTYFGQTLVNAVQSGSVPQTRIDDMALRILAAWYLVGQDSGFPTVNFDAWNINDPVNTHVNVQADHKTIIRNIGQASTVLLKNAKNALPLVSPKSIGIVGNGAGPSSRGPNGYTDRSGDDGVLAMVGAQDFSQPLDAITAKANAAGATVSSSLSDTDLNAAANVASGKDVALVFITADSGEGYLTVEGNAGDRNDLKAWHGGDALVAKVASANSNTVIIVNSVGPILMEAWIDHINVTAVVWSGLPGQEAGVNSWLAFLIKYLINLTGNSVTDILYGLYNPSGRLPYTIGKTASDYAAQVIYSSSSSILPIPYDEGLFVDYRHFDKNSITPRFEFGFGLSYTTFQYSSINISGSTIGGSAPTGSALDPW